MTPEQVTIVEETFQAAVPRADELAKVFYEILFTDNPGVREMFPDDLAEQRKKLVASLAGIVTNLRRPAEFEARVVNLGKRHVFYRAEPAHYEAVGDALLKALGRLFGTAFTPQVRAAWAAAYGDISRRMIAAAEDIAAHANVA